MEYGLEMHEEVKIKTSYCKSEVFFCCAFNLQAYSSICHITDIVFVLVSVYAIIFKFMKFSRKLKYH